MEKIVEINFGNNGTVADMEEILNKELIAFESEIDKSTIVLDFGSIGFIQLDSLMFLISFILKRKKKNADTFIKYPRNEMVASFLNTVRFFEIIQELTELNNIKDFVIGLPWNFEKSYLSQDIFKRNHFEYKFDEKVELTDEEMIERLKNKGFYPFVSLPFGSGIDKIGTLKDEPKKWTEGTPLISIIQKNLPSKVQIGDKISKHIIYESITNSLRHSSSNQSNRLVVCCSKPLNTNYYTLVIWDNGESIINTLKQELRNKKKIRTDENLPDDPHSCYFITKEKKKGRPKLSDWDYYFSYDTPDLDSEEGSYKKEDWYILLASFFPGVTRDPDGKDFINNVLENGSEIKLGGRGLTYLINTAVRTFGGEVRIRTSNYFVNIKRAEKDNKTLPQLFYDRFKNEFYVVDLKKKYSEDGISAEGKKIISTLYKAKFHEYPKEIASFYGNMITIHIPQK